MWGISWLAEDVLAYQEGRCFTKLVVTVRWSVGFHTTRDLLDCGRTTCTSCSWKFRIFDLQLQSEGHFVSYQRRPWLKCHQQYPLAVCTAPSGSCCNSASASVFVCITDAKGQRALYSLLSFGVSFAVTAWSQSRRLGWFGSGTKRRYKIPPN